MITLRRANQRIYNRGNKNENWQTFNPQNKEDPLANGFGALESIKEIRLAPGTANPRNLRHEAEILSYLHEGVLAYEDSVGHSGVLQAGEFQRVTSGRGLRHSKMNASRTDWAHFYQIWLRPSVADLEPGYVQKRFSVAERHGGLCVVASFDARRGSLLIHQNALIYSALLDPGQHVVRELSPGRMAWLHIVRGEVKSADVVLTTGDGAGFIDECSVSLTASEDSEILLVDLGPVSVPV
jgi:redox-sensitive bicupin YhaK (pirin superfamily)